MSLLAQIAIFLAAAVIAVPIFRYFKLGSVLGYLAAGIIIGPAGLGLISKIDAALHRIDDGTYGYCEETGEPIGIKRLEARPIATLSVEAQERHERRERVYRDD